VSAVEVGFDLNIGDGPDDLRFFVGVDFDIRKLSNVFGLESPEAER